MDSTIIVAVISMAGTVLGSLFGVLMSNNKTLYRIEQLERKVEKHNNVADRMIALENTVKSHQHQINDLKSDLERTDI